MKMAKCTEVQGMLPLYVGGDLEVDDTKSVATHLSDCADCQAVLARADLARSELRRELFARVDGHEPQLWPALRESLAREGMLTDERTAPHRTGHGLSLRSWRPFQVGAAVAASLMALFFMTDFGGGLNADGVRPASHGGALVETIKSKDVDVQAVPGAALRSVGAVQPDAVAESGSAPAGLRPVGLRDTTLFDQAREEILKQTQNGQQLFFVPQLPTPQDQGELASSLTLQ